MKQPHELLIERAGEFAAVYVALTEALIMRGVEAETAREEARWTAFMAIAYPEMEGEGESWRG